MAQPNNTVDPERGASLVEFAVLAPLLLLLVFGIIEMGWVFGQFNDLRHGVREGARFAAVDAGNGQAITDYVCDSMDLSSGSASIEVDLSRTGADVGDTGTITVRSDIEPLTGVPLVTSFVPDILTSTVSFRIEQDATWSVGTAYTCTP